MGDLPSHPSWGEILDQNQDRSSLAGNVRSERCLHWTADGTRRMEDILRSRSLSLNQKTTRFEDGSDFGVRMYAFCPVTFSVMAETRTCILPISFSTKLRADRTKKVMRPGDLLQSQSHQV